MRMLLLYAAQLVGVAALLSMLMYNIEFAMHTVVHVCMEIKSNKITCSVRWGSGMLCNGQMLAC